jgi:hypothetical protein
MLQMSATGCRLFADVLFTFKSKLITGLRIMAAINQRDFLLWKLLFLLLVRKKICRTNMKKEGKDVSEDSG